MDFTKLSDELHAAAHGFLSSRGEDLETVIGLLTDALRSGRKLLVFGNGGSASQAQHFAAELVNKFMRTRPPIRAVALTTDTAVLTSIANDTAFDRVFSRQVEALGDPDDIVLALTTSGDSLSVILALETARGMGLTTIALTGRGGGRASGRTDYLLDVPSESIPRIQEVHLLILHILAREIEDRLNH